jgi:hypothetical protein
MKGDDLITSSGIRSKSFPIDNSRVLIFCEKVVAWTQQQNFKQLGKM